MTWTHGTQYGYSRKGCRCPDCHAWSARKYAARQRRLDPAWQPRRRPKPAKPQPPTITVVPRRQGWCPNCTSGRHGRACTAAFFGPDCACGCGVLGYRGLFGYADPTAPSSTDQTGQVA